jgi:hypothetical protein
VSEWPYVTGSVTESDGQIVNTPVDPRLDLIRSSRRIRAAVPPSLLEQRCHGNLDAITDSDRRALRPIASSAHEVAARTGELLAELIDIPGVRIFRGVRAGGAGLPPIPHAISAGRRLVLIESVAWPPGHYETTANGRVYCDGIYIGQSVRQLTAAAEHWRTIVPARYQVTAMIVVHCRCGAVRLPDASAGGLAWTPAEDAAAAIRRYLPGRRQAASRSVLAALISATADTAGRDHDIPPGEWR